MKSGIVKGKHSQTGLNDNCPKWSRSRTRSASTTLRASRRLPACDVPGIEGAVQKRSESGSRSEENVSREVGRRTLSPAEGSRMHLTA